MEIIKIAHISDCHLVFPEVFSKTGYPNIFFKLNSIVNKTPRRFPIKIFRSCLREMISLKVDHFAFTGDLVNVGVEKEFENARNEFQKHYVEKVKNKDEEDERRVSDLMTFVPGNHDVINNNNMGLFKKIDSSFWKYFKDTHNLPEDEYLPSVKIVKDHIMIISLDTTYDTDKQIIHQFPGTVRIKELEKIADKIHQIETESPNGKKFFKILLMHHNPIKRFGLELVNKQGGLDKKTRGIVHEFAFTHNVQLILMGHHHFFSKEVVYEEGIKEKKKSQKSEDGKDEVDGFDGKDERKKVVCVDSGSMNSLEYAWVGSHPSYSIFEIRVKKDEDGNVEEFKLDEMERRVWVKRKEKFESKIVKLL